MSIGDIQNQDIQEEDMPKKRVLKKPSLTPKPKKEGMNFLIPRDCQVDLDRDHIYKIGKEVNKNVLFAMEQTNKSKQYVISKQIRNKIGEL